MNAVSRISAIIICQDEEDVIEDCLRSVAWMDEIVVIDSGSSDDTLEICRRYTDLVFSIPWQGYGAQKARALERATGDWVFSIDADERLTAELAASIRAEIAAGAPRSAYRVARRNFFLGRWMRHGGWYPDRQLRLFRREAGAFDERPVHEKVVVSGETGDLRGDLTHYTYNTLSEYIERQHRYTSLSAEMMRRQGKSGALWKVPAKPLSKFLEVYLLKQGFRDGAEGLIVAVLAALFAGVRQAKLWELSRRSG